MELLVVLTRPAYILSRAVFVTSHHITFFYVHFYWALTGPCRLEGAMPQTNLHGTPLRLKVQKQVSDNLHIEQYLQMSVGQHTQ